MERNVGMAMKFPVWKTTLDAFDYMWRERRALVRFGKVPLRAVILLSFAGHAIDVDPTKLSLNLGFLSLAQMIVYLPVTVTWYRIVVYGEEGAKNRPLFTLGRVEWRFLGWQVLCLIPFAGFMFIGIAISVVLGMFARDFGFDHAMGFVFAIAAVVWTVFWVVGMMLVVTRLSMVLVLVALDRPVSFKTAWKMTDGLGWRLVGATVVIALTGAVIGLLFKLVSFIIGTASAVATESSLRAVLPYFEMTGNGFSGLVTFIALATLFGFVYNMLRDARPELVAVA